MKKMIRSIAIILFITAGLTLANLSMAQPPSPPPSGSNSGNHTPMGGAAPIDGGLGILLAAGLGYGAKRVYQAKYSERKSK
jgi:hypothetical protein